MLSPEVIPLEFTSSFYLPICHFSFCFPHRNKPLDLTRCQILATSHKLVLHHEESQVVVLLSGPTLLSDF